MAQSGDSFSQTDRVVRARERDRGSDEPLFVRQDATVCGMGNGGDTPYISPSKKGGGVAGISVGDEVRVEVYRDRIVIRNE